MRKPKPKAARKLKEARKGKKSNRARFERYAEILRRKRTRPPQETED
ncbi:MAG: hypothetical protein AB7V08_13985 [Elusimicrobiales bacterium]